MKKMKEAILNNVDETDIHSSINNQYEKSKNNK
jgi:hypothetical protein